MFVKVTHLQGEVSMQSLEPAMQSGVPSYAASAAAVQRPDAGQVHRVDPVQDQHLGFSSQNFFPRDPPKQPADGTQGAEIDHVQISKYKSTKDLERRLHQLQQDGGSGPRLQPGTDVRLARHQRLLEKTRTYHIARSNNKGSDRISVPTRSGAV